MIFTSAKIDEKIIVILPSSASRCDFFWTIND